VRLPHELIQQALQTAPSSVDVYDRRGEFAFRLGNGAETRFGIGVTALYYQDPESEQVTPFTRQNMATLARLGDALPGLDVISTPGVVQDVAPERSDLYATLEMTANAVKPLVLLVSDETRFPDVLDLLAHLHGDPSDRAVRLNTRDEASDQSLAARPFIIPYFNPISPLVINRGTVDKMLVAIERGLPFMYSNYGMAGATTPITPAGTLALLNAELLAGLTLSQLIKPGTSIILGCLPAFFDMKGMGSFYDPHSYLINLACAELMAHYGLPHCGTSGSGMGWGADLIAGGHQWANHLSSCIGKVGLAPFVGDNLGSKAFSPAVVVYADGVIAQARRLVQGFSLDDDSLALDEIAEVGPGGSFLTSKLTLKHFRGAYYRSAVWPNLTLEEWEQKGRPRAGQELRSYTRDLLGRLSAPEDHDDLMAHGEAFIRTLAMRD
jgi:trimethylamine--corrinoid protein Co-methyltransferase